MWSFISEILIPMSCPSRNRAVPGEAGKLPSSCSCVVSCDACGANPSVYHRMWPIGGSSGTCTIYELSFEFWFECSGESKGTPKIDTCCDFCRSCCLLIYFAFQIFKRTCDADLGSHSLGLTQDSLTTACSGRIFYYTIYLCWSFSYIILGTPT